MYGHYIAVQFVRKNKGVPNEKVVAYYAKSLAHGQSRVNLIKQLLQALTPAHPQQQPPQQPQRSQKQEKQPKQSKQQKNKPKGKKD